MSPRGHFLMSLDTSVIFYLKTKGRNRGYSEYQDTNQSDGLARQLVDEIKKLNSNNLDESQIELQESEI